ncbi:MAG TPA: PIG-L deacetylase family protein [Thermoanaerobaculia bacterium]|nr:PIG-L deacetylase family protein [Thermoanaerobaculia bacterium]
MLRLTLPSSGKSPLRLLCLGAHSDDIEIGCGGTILRLLAERRASVDWVVFSADTVRAREARKAASLFLRGAAASRVTVRRFRDGFFPAQFAKIKGEFERLKKRTSPDLIFCPSRQDAHQDHRTVAELVWNTFRDHMILEYEIPKYDGDLGAPGFFVPLTEQTCTRKIELILKAFCSQAGRQWFREDTFRSLLRLRGIESNSSSGFAEAFYFRKALL